jgi:hypothetical protein
MSRWTGLECRRVLPVICGMIYLAITGPCSAAENTFDGVYSGKRVLIQGNAGLCPGQDDVSVTILGNTLKVTNSALRDFVLSFNPHPDGSFNQIYQDTGGTAVLIKGRVIGDILDADVTNEGSPCKHHWHLTKEH